MRKHTKSTDFACFIRNVTPQAIALTVPFGQMEGRPRMAEGERQALLTQNRKRVAGLVTSTPASPGVQTSPINLAPAEDFETPELL